MRRRSKSRVSVSLFLYYIFLSYYPEVISTAVVTLKSIEIFKTHEWLPVEPTVYFNCKGENRTFLPDVKKKDVLYSFKTEESWQPLTEFQNIKCKRCGFYEKDTLKSDDVFGEWEFCPADFTSPDGIYTYSVDKEFNATFSCRDCVVLGADTKRESSSQNGGGQGTHWTILISAGVIVSVLFILGLAAGFKYWQKRRREKDQARFLKLFEDGDDIEDELGTGPLGGSV